MAATLWPRQPFAQENPPVPAFPAQAEAITVDVVVVDKDGHPVKGLEKSDFTLLEDGRPQAITAFEPRALAPLPADSPTSEPLNSGVVTNETPVTGGGRTLAFLIDDLGMETINGHMTDVRKALANWLTTKADPRDEVTLLTTSGKAWWSDEVGGGREDLLAVLARIKGQKLRKVWTDSFGQPAAPTDAPSSVMPTLVGDEDPHTRDMLAAVERLSRGLAGSRGRKAIVIVSDGFTRDQDTAWFDSAIDASQRGNTAVYFVDARGLEGPPGYGADLSAPIPAGDMALRAMERQELAVAGASYVAAATGGITIRNTNDLLGGLERVADESSAYYLLGYQPENAASEKWHKLEVKVDRKGVTVRARRGYSTVPLAAPAPLPEPGKTRPLDPAATVAAPQDAIRVRMAPHLMEADAKGMVRVLVALEVDTSRLAFEGAGHLRKVAVDVTLVGVSRDDGKLFLVDERLQLEMDTKAVGGWYTFTRQIRLPPGVAQLRALVRDVSTGHAGAVSQRIEIPKIDIPRLSTPLLTERLETLPNGRTRLAAVAHRRFTPRGALFCAYSAYGLNDSEGRVTLKVTGAYTLQAVGGPVVGSAPPTTIAVSLDGGLTRTLVLPLYKLAAGDYDLTVEVVDAASGRNLVERERFSVEAVTAAKQGE